MQNAGKTADEVAAAFSNTQLSGSKRRRSSGVGDAADAGGAVAALSVELAPWASFTCAALQARGA